ncbi:hypothetical protein ACO2Q0_02990 [Phenylobacterium sp. VNQ135]|uniref:hypothetical protein n=1 Tax=Phenylobacterium sp. VNQ135 TaxID=3400922 RepID=UPI003C106512
MGVMCTGNPAHGNDSNRSLPATAARRLLDIRGAINLAPEVSGASDFLDTAEIVAGLDCVITVDTSVAHLAGTIGKPTFVLLPSVGVDWRWMRGRSDSPWYPSVTLVRQAEGESWNSVLDRAIALAEAATGTLD